MAESKSITHQMAIAANENIKEREYWLTNLSDPLVELRRGFPYDHAAADKAGGPVEHLPFEFSPQLSARLMKLRNNNDVRLNMVLLTGITVLLSKYAGSRDIVVGMPIYKQEQEKEFINTILPIRSSVEDTQSFKELLLAVRETIGKAVEHQNYPFPVIFEELRLPWRGLQVPLFDVMMLLENIHESSYIKGQDTSVTVTFRRDGDHVSGQWQYRSDKYDRPTMERIAAHFTRVMEAVLGDVNTLPGDISLLDEAEKKIIVEEFNGRTGEYRRDITLHQWFEEQVEQTPDNLAIVGAEGEEPVTYRQLNAMANQIALRLRHMGVRPDDLVGLMVEPSWKMAAGILGILKSGAAYLPFDLDYPEERIQFMMNDSAAKILVTGTTLKDLSRFSCHMINLDDPAVFEGETGNPEPAASPANLAYVIYTSGTTGWPKGVLVEHQQVTAYLASFFDQFHIGPGDVSIHLTSVAFDAFVEEMYPVLLRGGTFGIPGRNDMLDIARLSEFVLRHRVTMIDCTPLMLHELDKMSGGGLPPSLRIVISGGDVLKPAHVSHLKETGGVFNTYGPTESTVCAAYYHYTGTRDEKIIPIGKPILNYNVYILDRKRQLLPPGIGGEIGISGPGVTRGYLNRPELTRERFVPDPVDSSLRLYLTGDRGRWMPDGNILFLGRIDRQVKIRGYRIETGEIEKRLEQHEAVSGAVVTIGEDKSGEKYLVAYAAAEKADETELRHYLMARLPDYMVPQFFVVVEQFPRTPSGKIDKRALPEPRVTSKVEYVEPRDDIERAIRDTWREVFGFERIGVHDNFFDIGGHSLKGIQVINGIHKALNVKIGVENIFQYPTIAQLAEIVKAGKGSGYGRIEPQPERDFYEPSYAQKRFWILSQLNPQSPAYNMYAGLPLLLDDRDILEKAFHRLIERHESLRTSFKEVDGQLVQCVATDVPFQLSVSDLRELPAEEEEKRTVEISENVKKTVFQMDTPPLLRAVVVRGRDKSELLMVTHHLVFDGSSVAIFMKEFDLICTALVLEQEPELEPMPVQYKDFAHWQNRLMDSGEGMGQALDFWKEQLGGDLSPLPLPYDFALDQMQTRESRGYVYQIPGPVKDRLNEVAHEANATLFMVLLAGINLLFSFLTGRQDIILGGPAEARQHEDLSNVIGLFANTIVFRSQIDRQEIFTDFLRRVRENTLQALEHQSCPLELVCDELDIRFPELPVFFNMLDTAPGQDDGAGDGASDDGGDGDDMHTRDTMDAKTDLSFYFADKQDSIEIFCLYCSELFKPVKIEKMLKTYSGILEKIAEDPTLPLGKYKIKSGRRSRQTAKT